jgi:hypothetical protein
MVLCNDSKSDATFLSYFAGKILGRKGAQLVEIILFAEPTAQARQEPKVPGRCFHSDTDGRAHASIRTSVLQLTHSTLIV